MYGFLILKKGGSNPLYDLYKENGVVFESADLSVIDAKAEELSNIYPASSIKVIQTLGNTFSTTSADKLGNGSVDPILSNAEIDAIFNAARKAIYG